MESPIKALRRRLGTGVIFGAGGTWFFLASVFVNLTNFAFHAAVSRLLGADAYGALGALLSLLVVASVPLAGLQLGAAQAQSRHGERANARRLLMRTLSASMIVALLTAAATPGVERFFNLSSPTTVLWLACWLVFAGVGAAAQGTLLGRFRFGVIALALVSGTGVLRLLLGLGLSEAGAGPSGAMAATAAGQALTTLLLLFPLRDELRRKHSGPPLHLAWLDGLLPTVALTGLALLTGIDTLLARHFLDGRSSGIYSGAAIAGRIALFASGALALVAFPRFSVPGLSNAARRRLLVRALGGVFSVALLAALVLAAFPHLVVDILLGSKYTRSAQLLRILGVEGAGLSVVTLLVYFHVARRSSLAFIAWPASGAIAVLTWVTQPGSTNLAVITTAVVMTVTVVTLLMTLAAGVTPRSALAAPPPMPLLRDPAEIDLTLVVPFFNPGAALRPHLDGLVRVLDKTGISYELIPVSDGCTDGSNETLRGLPTDKVRPVVCTHNNGKGHALRLGLGAGRGRYLGFVDADGDLPAELVRSFVGVALAAEPDLAIGSKRHPGSRVIYPANRRLYSWVYQRLVHVLFGLSVRDTQTGLKIVRRDVLTAAMPRMLEKRFAFDLELLVVARRLGYRNVIELPVVVKERITTTISLKEVRRIMQDTLAIFYRLRVLRWYDSEEATVAYPRGQVEEPVPVRVA